jgi:Lon protease-like protein
MPGSLIDNRVREALAGFSGRLPLFPLPNCVQLPMTVLPLHIFEPRYRAMAAHAIAGEKLIGLALLADGWEPDYYGRPPIHPIVCAGRLIHVQQRENGTYDVLLEGLARARVLDEEPGGDFRMAKVEILTETRLGLDDEGVWRHRLDMLLMQVKPEVSGPIRKALGTLMNSQLPLGTLLDLIAHALPVKPQERQRVLDAQDVEARAKRVLEMMTDYAAHAGEDAPKRPAD